MPEQEHLTRIFQLQERTNRAGELIGSHRAKRPFTLPGGDWAAGTAELLVERSFRAVC